MIPSFKEYFYQLLSEMPIARGRYEPMNYDFPDGNKEEYHSLIDKNFYTTGKYKNYRLLYDAGGHKRDYFLLDDDKEQVTLYVTIVKNPTGYTTDTIWKYKYAEKGLMADFVLNVLLTIYPAIQSQNMHSEEAKNFWLNLIPSAMNMGYVCGYAEVSEGKPVEHRFDSVEDFSQNIEELWSDDRFRIKIYAK
jgi:hypothetical protein